MDLSNQLASLLENRAFQFAKIVNFDATIDQLLPFDFTSNNKELTSEILSDTDRFSYWVNQQLLSNSARYGIGGYNEHRTIYSRSTHFDTMEEPRRLHLGVDIWGPAETPVYNFYDGKVHSFQFNDHFGDYGATIILEYQLDHLTFHGLYGHLSLASLKDLTEGQIIPAGKQFASFGVKEENGFWPPHLHFQLIVNIKGNRGDYPGVCQFSKKETYLANCPDPMLILKQTFTSALT